MATASAASAPPTAGSSEETSSSNPNRDARSGAPQDVDGSFECNICLDTAKDAVVSLCGHLFWYVSHPHTHTYSFLSLRQDFELPFPISPYPLSTSHVNDPSASFPFLPFYYHPLFWIWETTKQNAPIITKSPKFKLPQLAVSASVAGDKAEPTSLPRLQGCHFPGESDPAVWEGILASGSPGQAASPSTGSEVRAGALQLGQFPRIRVRGRRVPHELWDRGLSIWILCFLIQLQ